MAEPKKKEEGRRHIWDDPKNVQKLLIVFFAACGVLLGLDLFVDRHLSVGEEVLPIEGWIGFYAFYGLAACVFLVLVAKQLRRVVMRDEDYYDR